MRSQGSGRLPPTHWRDVKAACDLNCEKGHLAVEKLLVRYRPPLLVHLRGKFSMDSHMAADFFQDFIHLKVITGNLLRRADQKRGRFRTFLLSALDNCVVDRLRQRNIRRNKPPGGLLPLDAVTEASLPSLVDLHDHRTEVMWGQAVIAGALLNMHNELAKRGRKDIWVVFERRVLRPLLDDQPPLDYGRLAKKCGYRSPAAAFNVLVTAKRMFKRHLRGVVAEYVKGDRALEDELGHLKRVLED